MLKTPQKGLNVTETMLSIKQMQNQQDIQNQSEFKYQKGNDFESNQDGTRQEWTLQEQDLLFKLHNQYGNKWAIIADHLKTKLLSDNKKSDNSVKNHFYSRLRKGLRKINKIISLKQKKPYKQFRIIDLYKVIEASDQKFKQVKTHQNQFVEIAFDLKNKIFTLALQEAGGCSQSKPIIYSLIDDLAAFTKQYKRKSKKHRRYSPMGAQSVYRSQIKNNLHQTQHNEERPIDVESQSEKQDLFIQRKNPTVWRKTFSEVDRQQLSKQVQRKDSQESKKENKRCEQSVRKLREQNKKVYSNFSQEEDQYPHQSQELRQQRLDHFAQNILKTFKSYYSLQSFKSNSNIGELLQ